MAEQNIAFNVDGMTNDSSVEIIKSAVSMLNGVLDVIVDIDAKRVAVEFDEERLSEDILKGTIEDAGFSVK